jgi:hypothetical protein
MTKTTFVAGSQVTPAFLNAINNPVFVTTADDDGEITKIRDADLDDGSDQIKAGWYAFRDGLKVTAGSGLVCNFAAGSVTLPLGTIQAITAGTITMVPGTTSTTTNYIWVNTSGSVVTGLTYPTVALPLASVVTASGAISSITDLRPRFRVQPVASAIKIFGGTGEQGDYNLASGTATFADGFYYYNNFTVANGATLTVSRFARIYCSGTVTIAGTITVTTFSSGGTTFSTGSASASSNTGGLSGSGPGAGSGSGNGSATYSYAAAPYGSGGASGFYSSAAASGGAISSGGAGGGGLWIEAAGAISVTSGVITARGGNGTAGSVSSGTPNISGGGGGSGGLILLSSLVSVTVSASAVLDVRGGDGAAAVSGAARGGGAGGGGNIVLISPSNNTTGASILRTAGSNGADSGTPTLGGGDGGSFGGTGAIGSSGTGSSTGQLVLRAFRAVG